MRKASPERPEVDLVVGGKEGPQGKAAFAKSKDKKKNKKKALKENKAAAESGVQGGEGSTASLANNQGKQAAPRAEGEPTPRLKTTPRGECSGQKTPES
jgi:hypothetical protein